MGAPKNDIDFDSLSLEELEALEADKPEIFDNARFLKICAVLTVLFTAMLPALITWKANASGLDLGEGLFPLAISLLVGLVSLGISALLCRKNTALTGLAGAMLAFLLMGYGAFLSVARRILPFLPAWLGSLLLAVLLLGGALFLLIRARNGKAPSRILLVLFVSTAVLTAFNLVSIVPKTVRRALDSAPYKSMQSPDTAPVYGARTSELPNIYYILMDEGADAYAMETYYGMEASENPLYTGLNERGFAVSRNSSAYTNLSVYCMANAFSLDYVCKPETTSEDACKLAFTGEWFKRMRALGYDHYQVSTHSTHYLQLTELSRITLPESVVCSVTNEGASVLDLLVGNSALALVSEIAGEDTVTFVDEIGAKLLKLRMERVADYYADAAHYGMANPTVFYTYLLPPHTPFFCDENGNTIPATKRCDWTDTRYYLGQYRYTANYVLGVVDDILANDPDAIVLIQSDHGIRGGLYTDESLYVDRIDQCRVINAVYGLEGFEIEGLSPVNTLRALLTAFGDPLPPVADMPHMFWENVLMGNGRA